jgi:signal transduction histidine kinase
MKDIEELKKELQETQLAYQMAAQMSQFKAGFLARTSHELRSPLSSLIGLHQLILSDLCESPEEEREFINQAYKSALKLMKLIDEIVSVAKIEYGSNQLHLETLQIEEIFNDVYSLTHLQAANRNLSLEISFPDSPILVCADRVRLVQSIVNLIDSGISLMEEGRITVRANSVTKSNSVKIEIDLQCSVNIWQEGIDKANRQSEITKEEIKELSQEINLSPAMKLLLSQTLMETMGGHLEVLDVSSEDSQDSCTRIVITCQQAETT